MYYTVYWLVNCKNGKQYIGRHMTRNLDDGYLGSGVILSRAIRKHGPDAFHKAIILVSNCPEEMFSLERELVNEEWVNLPDTYNIQVGGKGSFSFINDGDLVRGSFANLAPERRQQLSKKAVAAFHARRKADPSFDQRWRYRQSLSKRGNTNWLGRKHTEETRRKQSLAKKGKIQGAANPMFGRIWIMSLEEERCQRIRPEQLPAMEAAGWRRGRRMRWD